MSSVIDCLSVLLSKKSESLRSGFCKSVKGPVKVIRWLVVANCLFSVPVLIPRFFLHILEITIHMAYQDWYEVRDECSLLNGNSVLTVASSRSCCGCGHNNCTVIPCLFNCCFPLYILADLCLDFLVVLV